MNLIYARVGRSVLTHIVKTNGKTYCGRSYSTVVDGKVSQVCQRCMTTEGKANIDDILVPAEVPAAEAAPLDTIMSTAHYGSLLSLVTVSDSSIAKDKAFAPAVTSGSLATDMITMARNAIKALTPIRDSAYSAFIAARDCGKDEYVTGWAYQVYADTYRSVEEYERTINSITPEHSCENNYSEIGMTEECAYGCKIYRCSKCQDERTLHNATYGCKGL